MSRLRRRNKNTENLIVFKNGPFSLPMEEINAGSFVKPDRSCLNNRSLDWYDLDSPKALGVDVGAAIVVAGPYKLDRTKRYFVDDLLVDGIVVQFCGTVGLYAHVGPYMVEVTCCGIGGIDSDKSHTKDLQIVESGQSSTHLERACPIPAGTTAVEVVVYGYFTLSGGFKYEQMKLSLNEFDIQI